MSTSSEQRDPAAIADSARTAVFISYASEDAAAARRMADALRGVGIEVWLDECELRGGDEWDQCIRRQIRSCSLFLALISANTQARAEGYFRREWHLAVARMFDMARGLPFLLPVVIDDTPQASALVPEEFLSVQWSRISGDAALREFTTRVQTLLGATRRRNTVLPVAAFRRAVPRSGQRALVFCAIALIIAAAAFMVRPGRTPGTIGPDAPAPVAARATTGEPAIAVLPFANLSDDKENEYFSEGVSEELLNALARIPGLRVAARKSAFSFKGRAVADVARALGVDYVLDGTVRRSGNFVRITAQLINANDGFHLWSDRFDRELKDIFALQDEIAHKIVGHLGRKLFGVAAAAGTGAAAVNGGTCNPEAYQAYLRGRFFLNLGTAADYQRALGELDRATNLDPAFALAWAERGRVYSYIAQFGLTELTFRQSFEHVRTSAERALQLEPNLAYGHALRAHVRMVHDWNVPEGMQSIRRAVALAPSDAWIASVAGMMHLFLGDRTRALEFTARAKDLDPVNPQTRVFLAVVHFYSHQLDAAENEARRALELEPSVMMGPSMLSYIYLLQGRVEEALAAGMREPTPQLQLVPVALAQQRRAATAEADQALAELAQKYGSKMAVNVAQIYAFRGDTEKAFAWLQRACEQRDSGLIHAKLNPFLANLHGDPRWQQFLQRLGLGADADN